MKSFFPWIGGKSLHAKKITSEFPESFGRYLEVFGGGGSVLFFSDKHADIEDQRQWIRKQFESDDRYFFVVERKNRYVSFDIFYNKISVFSPLYSIRCFAVVLSETVVVSDISDTVVVSLAASSSFVGSVSC